MTDDHLAACDRCATALACYREAAAQVSVALMTEADARHGAGTRATTVAALAAMRRRGELAAEALAAPTCAARASALLRALSTLAAWAGTSAASATPGASQAAAQAPRRGRRPHRRNLRRAAADAAAIEAVRRCRGEHGRGPTVAALGVACERSDSWATAVVARLIAAGRLARDERGLLAVESAEAAS